MGWRKAGRGREEGSEGKRERGRERKRERETGRGEAVGEGLKKRRKVRPTLLEAREKGTYYTVADVYRSQVSKSEMIQNHEMAS